MRANRTVFKSLGLVGLLLGSCFEANASSLELGYGGVKIDYNEVDAQNKWLDSEKSSLSDVTGGYVKYVHDLGAVLSYEQSIEAYYSFLSGTGTYDGHLQNLVTGALTPHTTNTHHELSQGHVRYKIENMGNGNKVGWFLGLGHRAWDRDIQGVGGYLEEYRWKYGELGLSGLWHDRGFFTGFEVSYQQAIAPTMKAYMDGGMDFDLGKTNGYKIVVPLGYELDAHWSVSLNYVLDKWESKASDVVAGNVGRYVEPESSSKNEYGFVALRYTF